jgi:hypothetical protein
MTVSELVKSSLRLIGAIATGETPSADELSDGIFSLNDMLEHWSNEGILVNTIQRETFPFVVGQSRYSIGDLGDFNTVRPMRIEKAMVKRNGTELPIEVITESEFYALRSKNTESTLPRYILRENKFPLDFLNFYPVPSEPNELVLYSQKPFARYTLGSDVINLPPGYTRAIRYNLAVELAQEYGKQPNALTLGAAEETKSSLIRQNTQAVYMVTDAFVNRTTFHMETGE